MWRMEPEARPSQPVAARDGPIAVKIGALEASRDPEDVLVAYGLGSCVAVCLYDPIARVGGMIHSLLPTSSAEAGEGSSPAKFVDRGVPALVSALESKGALRRRLSASLCGGAQMLKLGTLKGALNIGERNVQSAESALQKVGIRIQSRDVGGNSGRTVFFRIADGNIRMRSYGKNGNSPSQGRASR